MQVISAIVCRQQLIRVLRIAHGRIEVYHGIEVSRRANPIIHCLPVSLAQRTGMIVIRSHIGRDRRAKDSQPVCVGPRNDLPIGGDDLLHMRCMRRGLC